MNAEAPPRLIHNEKLAKDFYKSRGIESSSPPVFSQLESVVINRKAVKPFGYNGSIVSHKGRILLAYRWHPNNTAASELAIAELDDKFNVKNDRKLVLVPSPPSGEDSRFFIFKDELHVAWVESQYPAKMVSVVKFGLLINETNWRVVDVKQPAIGNNDGEHLEKNWVLFERDKQLFCLYQSYPEQIIFNLSRDNEEHRSNGLRWRYGDIRGGCIIEHKGKLLRFFHSRLNTFPPPVPWRYYLGCCLMEPEPPFKVIAINPDFLAQASEVCDLPMLEQNSALITKPALYSLAA